jgi:tetratricopeptide (TPR) repeat protein
VTAHVLKAGNREKANTYFNQAVQFQKQGKLTSAISAYSKAIATDPSYAQAYYNLAIAHRDSNQLEHALDNYELALQANEKFTDARFNYAILLKELGYTDDAIAQYEILLQQNPNEASLHLTVATLYAHNRATLDAARLHYEAYLRLAPNSPLERDIRRWLDQNH